MTEPNVGEIWMPIESSWRGVQRAVIWDKVVIKEICHDYDDDLAVKYLSMIGTAHSETVVEFMHYYTRLE